MPDSNLERAYEYFKRAARELEIHDGIAPEDLAAKLRSVANRVLDALEGADSDAEVDALGSLDRQSRDIANDLRRAERLIKERLGED